MNRLFKVIAIPFIAFSLSTGAAVVSADSAPQRDLKLEEENRALVMEFYDRFFNKHEVDEAAEIIVDSYIQHNPHVPDGKAPFVGYFSGFFKDNPQSRARVMRSATDADLVYLHVHATNGDGDRGRAVIDIFRVEGGKIVEHWDVIQDVPETSANANTMF